ncbi:MAG TPA: pyridoxal-dependent decarboxylase [Kofleriaceae bacterium]|nr:pyridoxal-dependent decarboxylase [Kofleriaceae bacterium]
MSTIRDVYDPSRFRADGHRLIDALADLLERMEGRDERPVLALDDPKSAVEAWTARMGERADLVDTLVAAADGSTRLHHPRYLGHQVPPPAPGGMLADLVAAFCNNGMAVYEMGPTAVPIELACVTWMAEKLGLPKDAGGLFTSGGSLGNLTALLAARQAAAGFDVWGLGAHAGPPLAVLCSDQVHYSIARALKIMGWGEAGAIPVATDERLRLDPSALPAAMARAQSMGRKVIAVVASAGATATGALDPIPACADFCAQHELWLHVDGAHGAALAMSARHKHKIAGIERADSIVWDAHKMLAMPALCTAVLFRRHRDVYQAFAQEASYLFAGNDPDDEWWNLGLRTMECTKRMMALELYACVRAYGDDFFRDYVERVCELGASFAQKLEAAGFEVLAPPDMNIICYRVRGHDDEQTARLRTASLADGRFYILKTRARGALWLRSAIMNPLTEPRDLDELIAHLQTLARA